MLKNFEPNKVIKIPLRRGIGGIFFSKIHTTTNEIIVAIMRGGIATEISLLLL